MLVSKISSQTPPTCINTDNVSIHMQAPASGMFHLYSIWSSFGIAILAFRRAPANGGITLNLLPVLNSSCTECGQWDSACAVSGVSGVSGTAPFGGPAAAFSSAAVGRRQGTGTSLMWGRVRLILAVDAGNRLGCSWVRCCGPALQR